MPDKKSEFKKKFKNWIKKEKTQRNFKLFALFLLGFLIGVMFKSQALRNLVIGYDDHRILKNEKASLEKNLPVMQKNKK